MDQEKLKELLQNVVNTAADNANIELENKISSLTRLKDDEIKSILDNGISSKDLVEVLKEITDATKNIEEKTETLSQIKDGVKILIQLINNFIK